MRKIIKFFRFTLILFLLFGWIFNYPPINFGGQGWPQIFNPSKLFRTGFPPGIQKVNALDAASGDGLILYGISGSTTPQQRTYNGSTNAFGAETAAVTGGTGTNFVTRASPTKQEAIAAYTNASGVLQVMCYDGTSWTNEWSVTAGGTGATRRFDIAYETNTGDVIVVYSRNAAATNAVDYRTKAGSTGCGTANWAAAASMPTTVTETTGTVAWVKAAWDKRAAQNLIAVIWADSNNDLGAAIWSGTAFGGLPTAALSTTLDCVAGTACAAADIEAWDVEYESLSGDVMVTWGDVAGANGTNGARYQTCTGGTSTCTWGTATAIPLLLDDATVQDLTANPNTDEMLFASLGVSTGLPLGSDLQGQYWSGTAWLAACTLCANTDDSSALTTAITAGTKLVATGWLISGATTRGVVVYNDLGSNNIDWFTFTGSTFTAQTDFTPTPSFGGPQKWSDIQIDPFNKDRFIFTVSDTNNDVFAKRLIMTSVPGFTWTNADGGAALQANLPAAIASPFSLAYWRFIPAPTFNQSAYRLFNNLDSTDVGSPLTATQDQAATLGSTGALFRLRMLLHVGANQLIASGQAFKLQFAQQSGACDADFVGESYDYVTTVTVIAYKNNDTPNDGDALTANGNDPVHSGHTSYNQTYEELNDFTNSVSAIPSGQDGKWDFALFDNGAPANTTYCLRAVKSDAALLNTYSVIPEITTASGGVIVSVSVSDGAVDYGFIAINVNKSTIDLSDTQTMTNDGNVAETFSIKGATSTPGNWNLGTAPSSERYQHQFSTTTGSAWVNLNSDSYVNATSSVAATKTSLLDLKIFTPTVTTHFDAQGVIVTVQATQS